ncbi:DNA ligase 1-like [Agrilus planipennis]|uniref:DNA ligase 1-like n=1 Tax=Agrilus planipennis TaxID=224129 RepID=A0A1W4X5U6_AGRPL|nr:DNA ligase 1-like [Agrilus planipennis]
MVSVGREESSDSDTNNTNKKTQNSGVSPKNTSLQKNMLHAASLSAKKDFLSKMLEKSDRIKDLTTLNVKDIETPRNCPNSLPLKGILKKSFSKKSDYEYSDDSETNNNSEGVFTPKFALTNMQEETPKIQKNKKNSNFETNKSIKEAFKTKLKMVPSKKSSDSNTDSEDGKGYKRDLPDIGSLDRFRAIRGRRREVDDDFVKKSKNKALNSEQDDSSDSDDNSNDNLYLQNLVSKNKHNNEKRHSESVSKIKPSNNKNSSKNKLISIESDLSDASSREMKKSKSKRQSSLEYSRLENSDSDYDTKTSLGVKRKNKNLSKNESKNKRLKVSDSSSDSEVHNELNRRKSKLKKRAQTPAEKLLLQFETERDDLNKIDVSHLDYSFPSKSPDYELFMAKIPKDLRSSLSGAKLSLTTTTKINTNQGKFVCVPSEVTEGKEEVNFFSQENGELKIITTKLCGKLKAYQELETVPEMEMSENKNRVALPDNLKQRHPLFGPNYVDKIELKEDIKHKLETSALPIKIKSKKHKKNKQKDLESHYQSYEHNELIFQILGKSQEQISDAHYKRNEKSKKEITENMDILEYLNKNVFNEREKKKKLKEKTPENSINKNDLDIDNVEEKKRKKKRKRENEYEDSSDIIKDHKRMRMTMSSEEEPTDGIDSFKVKHKKNRKS